MFDRTLKIINDNDFKIIQDLNILIIGIGGVGGYILETLVRMGVLNITIVDHDVIDILKRYKNGKIWRNRKKYNYNI